MARLVPLPPHGFDVEMIAPERPLKDGYARGEIDQLRRDIKEIEDKLRETCVPTEEVKEWVFTVTKKENGMTITAKAKT